MLVDLTQYLWILWLALVVLFIVIEVLTLEFTFLMIAAGTLIGGLGANLLGWPWWLQVALAAAISGLLIFTLRPVLLMNLDKGADPAKSNVDALYELGGRVTGPFTNGIGEVKLDNGETWTARVDAVSPVAAMAVGTRVAVSSIEGAIAVVVPEPPKPGAVDLSAGSPNPNPNKADRAKPNPAKPNPAKPRATKKSPRKEEK
ncbi:NfeD family protein [Salinibacterium sp. M195]|uniref:NfeD family protein n=1 Tax=Salinibacterium sp. M195 TaxID=2583374 RepID=UPI002104EFC7|nr:NfeD family protein [Salinibacterium sp. M195]QYH36239.1 NfeD family protein [Salinibacterium sp. M195]